MFIPLESDDEIENYKEVIPEWRVRQIQSLWRTRGDSFSRFQLREIIRLEKIAQIRREGDV